MSETALVKADPRLVALKQNLNSPEFTLQVKRVIPSGVGGERLIRGALTCVQVNPKLAECEPTSFFSALLTVAQLGLNLDGRECHLVPFWNPKAGERGALECKAIPDYKGLVRLAITSGQISHIHADVVCDGDDFEYDRGRVLRHKINWREERGNVYCVYAFATFKDGTEKAECMGVAEVEAVRRKSKQPDGAWKTDWNEMAKKSVTKRLMKWVPLQPAAAEAVALDDDQEFDSTATVTAPPPAMTRREEPKTIEAPKPPAEPAPAAAPTATPAPAEPMKRRGRPPLAKPADVPPNIPRMTDDQRKVADWAHAEPKINFDEVVTALIEFGEMEEKAVRASFGDLLPNECAYILGHADGLREAIIASRG